MRQTGRSSVVATTARVRVERRGCSEQKVGATARLRLHGETPSYLVDSGSSSLSHPARRGRSGRA